MAFWRSCLVAAALCAKRQQRRERERDELATAADMQVPSSGSLTRSGAVSLGEVLKGFPPEDPLVRAFQNIGHRQGLRLQVAACIDLHRLCREVSFMDPTEVGFAGQVQGRCISCAPLDCSCLSFLVHSDFCVPWKPEGRCHGVSGQVQERKAPCPCHCRRPRVSPADSISGPLQS